MAGQLFTYDAPEDVAPPPRRRRRWWIVTVAVGLVVLIAAAVVRFWPSSPDTAAPAAAGPQPAPAAPAMPGQSCGKWNSAGLPLPTAAELAMVPPVTWTLVSGMATPGSADTGPAFGSPVRWCYAH